MSRVRSITRRRRLIVVAAVLPMLMAVGCATEPLRSQGSLLDDGGAATPMCLPAAGQVGYTYGVEMLRNVEASPVTITAVLPNKATNVTVLNTYLVPIDDGTPVGNGVWPPAPASVKGLADPSLLSYTDLTVPGQANSPTTKYNLVLHLGPVTTQPAGFDGLRIEYTADNRAFYQNTHSAFAVKPSC